MGTKESHYSNIKLSETGDHCSASYEYKTNKYVKLACSEQRRHHRNTQYAGACRGTDHTMNNRIMNQHWEMIVGWLPYLWYDFCDGLAIWFHIRSNVAHRSRQHWRHRGQQVRQGRGCHHARRSAFVKMLLSESENESKSESDGECYCWCLLQGHRTCVRRWSLRSCCSQSFLTKADISFTQKSIAAR